MKHELIKTGQAPNWHDLLWGDGTPLKDHLNPAAIALFLDIHVKAVTRRIGLRKYGSTHIIDGDQNKLSHQLGIVGLDADMRAEAYVELIAGCEIHAEGCMLSCGGKMFDNPIEKTPAGNLTWETIDLAADCPGAKGILFEVWYEGGGISTGIRKHGSTDARVETAMHTWGVVGCDENQLIDWFTRDYAGWKNRLWIVGYIKGLATFETDAPDITPLVVGSYQTVTVPTPGKLIFLEITSGYVAPSYALRASGSAYDEYFDTNYRHNWAMVPANPVGEFEAKVEHARMNIYRVGEGH